MLKVTIRGGELLVDGSYVGNIRTVGTAFYALIIRYVKGVGL